MSARATPPLSGRKLGVLITTEPGHPHFPVALALIHAALDAGVRVYLYCIDDGVQAIATPEIQAIKSRGASLFGCAYGGQHRGLPNDESAAWSGLTVLADVIGSTDRFVSF